MMAGRTARRRPWLALLLAVQLFGVAVPLADARADAVGGPVHIEERTDRSCAPVHLDGECVLCQHLAQRQDLAASAPCVIAETIVVTAASAPTLRHPSSIPAFLERGRSPPTI